MRWVYLHYSAIMIFVMWINQDGGEIMRERKETRKIDTLKGIGKLRKDDQIIAEATYVIFVYKEFIIADSFESSPKEIEGMGHIKGSFRVINPVQKIKPDEVYTLELSDGRKVDTMMPSLILPDREIEIYLMKAEGFK